MAASGKKQKKRKGKTFNLNDFLADEQRGLPGGPGSNIVRTRQTMNSWAEEAASLDLDGRDYGDSTYKTVIDRSMLPTAPRAARGPDINLESIPQTAPFIAYIGNLPYDIEQEKIAKFFSKLKVSEIRLPLDRGSRGFGYVYFSDRESLIEALSMNDDVIHGRKIRIDLPGNTDRDDRRGGHDHFDRTDCDWRRPRDDDEGGGRGFDRDNYGDRDRFGDRDRDRGGFSNAAPETGRWERSGPTERSDRNDRYSAAPSDTWDRGVTIDKPNNDRWGDRDRGFDRERGGGGGFDRERGGGGGGFDRERGGGGGGGGFDRERGGGFERYGDRGYDRGYGNNRYREDKGYNRRNERSFERRGFGGESEPSRESSSDPPKDRPRLNLKPRSVTATEPVPESSSSIFGGARPVDTSQREKEIEARIRREGDIIKARNDEEKENNYYKSNDYSSQYPGKGERDTSRRDKRQSGGSTSSQGRGIKPTQNQPRTRCDSRDSSNSEPNIDEKEEKQVPLSPRKEDPPTKMVPAPPPKENIWERRKTEQQSNKGSESSRNQKQYNDSSKRGDGVGENELNGKAYPNDKHDHPSRGGSEKRIGLMPTNSTI
ncbi:eukaryotic translation initiation factor 4B isoform X2 [Octopus bimaculoides]|uniref:eukaryotic translation initiation factor 4B isoform X2 n=1 Tax=Octopus bimaculoides TaxID=37653 RepID=UPI0022E6C640|nr:eukaryotic translation initiation factor 4B isoform X2 [Octopus bimaculoides]